LDSTACTRSLDDDSTESRTPAHYKNKENFITRGLQNASLQKYSSRLTRDDDMSLGGYGSFKLQDSRRLNETT
jgi:hypothetical protein